MLFASLKNARSIPRLAAFIVCTMLCAMTATAMAAHPKIRVVVGQSITQQLATPVKTVSIADSKVADVVVAGSQQVLVNGKAIGLTTLVVWDEAGRSSIFDVVVQGPFSDQQIELRVRVAEVNRTKASEMGFDFLLNRNDGDDVTAGVFGGQVATPGIPLAVFEGTPVDQLSMALRYVTGGTEITSMVKAMMSNGVLKVLAEPNVVASSGQDASFLSGGEIPIPVASSGVTGGSTVTIEWKEFGIKVNFLPTIVDSGVINLRVAPEVSSLDYGNGIELSGFRIPALRSRKAETVVELKDRETLVIGGLMMEEETRFKSRIPVLGHLPLLGALFSDTRTSRTQNELLLVVSPRITRALAPGTPMPTLRDQGAGD